MTSSQRKIYKQKAKMLRAKASANNVSKTQMKMYFTESKLLKLKANQ